MNKIVNIFFWLKKSLCSNCICDNQDLLMALVDHLLNIIKGFKKLRKTGNLKYIYKNELDLALPMMQHIITVKI